MKWMHFLAILTMFFSIKSFSFDEYQYDELLEKHLSSGHLTNSDIDHQKFERINSKKYHKEFNEQVRGVASKLNDSKKILKLSNPEIDLSKN